ncbi:MAG TPA: hypothetical protein VGL72_27620 [Bryobacteraceae bacterium]|jgi:hypothetical protein
MRDFGVVFRIRVNSRGRLVFACGGRCAIKRGNSLVFKGLADPEVVIDTKAGEILDVAVAHDCEEWTWGARIEHTATGSELLTIHLPRVVAKLRKPTGPPLKVFTDARCPIRTIVSIYSMILNGYSPAKVYLYGGYQWKPFARILLAQFLPFASLVKQPVICGQITQSASSEVADLAKQHWMLMKACVSLFCDPADFCAMDDDLFILKPVSSAVALAGEHDLVFAPDNDNAELYQSIWGDVFGETPVTATARLNGALYWLQMRKDRKRVGELMMRGFDKLSGWNKVHETWAWEQGFYAHLFAGDRVVELPKKSYWYPYLSGLPGGMMGYDYANNPCGFTMIHFGGDVDKPTDGDALTLMPQILGDGSPTE